MINNRIRITSLYAVLLFPLALSAGEFSLALEGTVSADLYETDYFSGISPEYSLRLNDHSELLIALPLRCRGELFFRQEYTQHTQFISAGLAVAWWRTLYAGKKIGVFWGPDLFFNYGFPPMTWRTMGNETTRVNYSRYFVHSGGFTWPVRLDFHLGKRWELRLYERLFGVYADSRWVDGYDSTIKFEAGLIPMLSPVVAVIAHF